MTKVIEHGDILLVEVPEGAKNFVIDDGELFYLDFIGIQPYSINIPQGNWTILGKADSITEEQWGKVAEQVSGWSKSIFYDYTANGMDYRDIVDAAFDTATESGHSLLSKYGLKPETTLILIKQ